MVHDSGGGIGKEENETQNQTIITGSHNLHYPVMHGRLSKMEERLPFSLAELPQSDLFRRFSNALND
jgi:hypothetical protein